jgi:hypothetical protein
MPAVCQTFMKKGNKNTFRRHTEAKRKATIKRVNQRHPDTIDEDEEDSGPREHHAVTRTNTFKDPEGLEEREI